MTSGRSRSGGGTPIDEAIFRPGQPASPRDDTPDSDTETTLRPEELTAIEASTTWTVPPVSTTSPMAQLPDDTSTIAAHDRRIFGLPLARFLRSEQPLPMSADLVPPHDDVELKKARQVVDLIQRVAVMAISVGASVSDAVAMGLRIADTFGTTVHIDVNNTAVIVTQQRSLDDDPITSLRVVRGRTSDYHRLGKLQHLVDDICSGRVDLAHARGRLDALVTAPRLYRPWFVTTNMGLMGGAIAALFGGSGWDMLISCLATCLVDITVQAMSRKRITSFFTQAVGGAIPTLVALVIMVLRWRAGVDISLSPSLVVASGMISLLAGSSMVAAAQDALDGYVVTSSGRILEVFVQTGGIILGVMSVLWIGLKFGVPGYINPTLGFSRSVLVQIIACAAISWTFGATSHARARTLLTCAALGALSWIGYLAGMAVTSSMPAASGVGAFLVGVVAALGSRSWNMPQVGLVTTGVVPLMPGMMIYRGLYMVMNQQFDPSAPSGGGTVLMQALLVGVAIAVGSSLGALTARPLIIPLDRATRSATLRSWRLGASVPRDWAPRHREPNGQESASARRS
ncbi:threonine/serine exporter family protein [Acidipropionibacterium timonense]|uniref:threonine/serine ThrE exporter family protein n=1 Tax=Acidipropionibacterium timonense TaxID=2161818 RepID=UPI001FD9D822|nr:threonine/serine exporter family protein [Acidipropionibacterium timonense]